MNYPYLLWDVHGGERHPFNELAPQIDDGTGRSLNGRYNATLAKKPVTDFFTLGESTVGELSDAQIWTVARPAADIKATMHLVLTGREEGLAAYYRLAALVDGDPVTAPDFAAGQRDAQVFGEPYTGARRLGRATKSGARVVKYGNDALVAVSQRGTYEESFEFKVNAGTTGVDVNNADGTGMKVLLDDKRVNTKPVVSPDGRTIAFQSDRAVSNRAAASWPPRRSMAAELVRGRAIHRAPVRCNLLALRPTRT